MNKPASSNPPPVVEARAISKKFGDRMAVNHLDLEVPARVCFGLLGPNGAGKTTTIGMVLGLIYADNLLQLFIFWELVGLCSYLLIGFWFDQAHGEGWRNSNAARKAFLVNRVGDAGFIVALLIIGTKLRK